MIGTNEPPLLTLRGPWGVPVQVSPSFILLALVFVGVQPSIHSLIFFGMVALSIFLHEMGHAWGALVQGQAVRRVVLYGGGGFCEYARQATPRERELMVAMGPLTNLALWAVASLAGGAMVDAYQGGGADWHWYAGWYLQTFAGINLVLFALNLIPVQPLDGGKLLYLALLRFLSPGTALRVTGFVGLLIAVAWVPAMIYVWMTWGWALLLFPSVLLHWRMVKGEAFA
ncbi:MAG: site-2 protease family protein [Pseudomonadota bacterium]